MLSVVIPAHNEAPNLPALVREVVAALRPLVATPILKNRLESFEILLVDDGSSDDTATTLERLALVIPELRPLRLIRKVGQSAATVAGCREARGEWIATLDADLQNPPAALVQLWDALPGHDAALGWRIKREDRRSKRLLSRWANRIRNLVLGQSIKDTGCSVRIFPREMALRLPSFKGFHRFLGPLLLREGCRIVQVPIEHRPRIWGTSHYGFWNRSYQVVIDLLGVVWLMHRSLRYELAQSARPQEPASRIPAPHYGRSAYLKAAAEQQEAA
jgi:glycosyltransferase involved in cell wall biosynthesis